MINTFYRKWIILGILFLLPVIFLLFLYPSTHNYNTLDIVNEDIKELEILNFIENKTHSIEVLITTTNRIGFFKKSFESILNAKKKTKNIIKDIFIDIFFHFISYKITMNFSLSSTYY